MKIFYELDIGYAGCGDEGEIEVDDNMTDKQIDEYVHEMALDWAQSWDGDERLGDEWDEEGTAQFYENVSGSWRHA